MEENRKELEAAKIEEWDQDVVGGEDQEYKPADHTSDTVCAMSAGFAVVRNGKDSFPDGLMDGLRPLDNALGVDPTNAFPGGASSRYETG